MTKNSSSHPNPRGVSHRERGTSSTNGKHPTVNQITRKNVEAISSIEHTSEEQRTTGEWLADLFAAMVGSWTFILIQSALLVVWVVLNIIAWSYKWDPYPFILLNLALSFQAAFASPIIMMSQNRQSQIADKRNRLDLQINLLSEQENTEMLRLLRRLCEANGVGVEDDSCAALEQETSAKQMLQQIDKADNATKKARPSSKRDNSAKRK
ncbi:MAG TPA: DUF1003 domain-containing protein [Lacipirellulaceae bacterium]|nr:DUF1003 domain-containing protein [Lacipirellulaceae bacterium]